MDLDRRLDTEALPVTLRGRNLSVAPVGLIPGPHIVNDGVVDHGRS